MDIAALFLQYEGYSLEAIPANNQSAFVKYNCDRSLQEWNYGTIEPRSVNIHKRMIEMLKKGIGSPNSEKVKATMRPDRDRSFLHMVNERMRRASERRMYSSLHSLLPPGIKSDKNSIVEAAIKEIKKMERCKEELQKRNRLIEMKLDVEKQREKNESKMMMMRLSVANNNPAAASGIDSMVQVLKCLNQVGCRRSTARKIRSKFSLHGFSTEFQVDSKVEAQEVEKEVGRSLKENGKKFIFHYPTGVP